MMSSEGRLIEIFSSRQGEGPYVGAPMTFVRFETCTFGCHYCDTPESFKRHRTFRVEAPPTSEQFSDHENPVDAGRLNDILKGFPDEIISVTGGEPLEQGDFLTAWFPTVDKHKKILLETNGIHPQALTSLTPFTSIVSMDIKPPSSTGLQKTHWEDHRAFLQICRASGIEVYVKVVVTEKTLDAELDQAISLVTCVDARIPFILQPVSPTPTFSATVSPARLADIQQTCRSRLADVRVIPQMHKAWGVL